MFLFRSASAQSSKTVTCKDASTQVKDPRSSTSIPLSGDWHRVTKQDLKEDDPVDANFGRLIVVEPGAVGSSSSTSLTSSALKGTPESDSRLNPQPSAHTEAAVASGLPLQDDFCVVAVRPSYAQILQSTSNQQTKPQSEEVERLSDDVACSIGNDASLLTTSTSSLEASIATLGTDTRGAIAYHHSQLHPQSTPWHLLKESLNHTDAALLDIPEPANKHDLYQLRKQLVNSRKIGEPRKIKGRNKVKDGHNRYASVEA